MKPGTYRRLGLVAPLALLALAFLLSSVYGQRPPIRPPIMPRPPAFNPNPGMPGMNPNPGMPGFNPNPNPGMPGFNPNPNPGMVPRMPNPGLGGHVIETVWTCSGCGKEIGRNTAFPPSVCPHCGARIVNGIGPANPVGPMTPPGMPGGQPPGFNPNPNPGMPGFNPNPNPGMPGFNPNLIPNPGMAVNPKPNPDLNNRSETVWTCNGCGKEVARNTPAPPSRCPFCGIKFSNGVGPDPGPSPLSLVSSGGSDSSGSSSGAGKSKFSSKVIALVVGIVVIGILALLGGTFLMIYTMKSGSEAPPRRRRRHRDDYDD